MKEVFKFKSSSNRASERALDFFDREGIALHSLLIAHKDEIITESYYSPYDRNSLLRLYSITKSINALGIGILLKKGQLSLDDKIASFFPEYVTDKTDKRILDARVRDLLMMKSPYTKTCYKGGAKNGNNVSSYQKNWVSSFFTSIPDRDPGTFFSYDTGASVVLAKLIEKVSGTTYMEFFMQELFSPLGIAEDTYILSDPVGNPQGGSGLMMRPLDLLKIIYLVKEGGMGIIDSDYLKEATSPLSDTTLASLSNMRERRAGYGYQIWCVGNGSYAFVGLGGQFALAVPDKDLVFVTTADTQVYDAYSSVILKVLLRLSEEMDPSEAAEAGNRRIISLINRRPCPLSDMIFSIDDNQIGVTSLSLSFNEDEGEMKIMKDGTEESYPFYLGRNRLIDLKEESSSPALASASYNEDGTLALWVQFIGECQGGLTFELAFKEDRLSMRMRLYGELMFDGYSGVLTGNRV